MKLIVIELEELEKLLRQIVREELRGEVLPKDEIGDVNLATAIIFINPGTCNSYNFRQFNINSFPQS